MPTTFFLPFFIFVVLSFNSVLFTAVESQELTDVELWEGFYAAACCTLGPACRAVHAERSGSCITDLWMNQQEQACRTKACTFCRHNRTNLVCETSSILRNCFNRGPPYPKPHPIWDTTLLVKASPVPKQCTYHSRDGVLNIAAGMFPVRGKSWKRMPDGSVIWKVNGGRGIDPPKRGDAFCIMFRPDRDGLHYFTVISAGAQYTDHNDAWFRFSSKAILFRPQSGSRKSRRGWIKGFQNRGERAKTNYILTINNNGHQLFMDGLKKGNRYEICAAGRSSKFQLYNIILMSCETLRSCNRKTGKVQHVMSNLPPPSTCY